MVAAEEEKDHGSGTDAAAHSPVLYVRQEKKGKGAKAKR